MAEKMPRLGNVDNIFSSIVSEKEQQPILDKSQSSNNVIDGKRVRMVGIDAIKPDPNQPRKNIDPDGADIKELAESIKKHGFINFITVRENGQKNYIIVAGERRFTAAKVAGLDKIPVMVLADDKQDVDCALLQLEENLQREDLSYFEEAEAYLRLKSEFGLQQKEIAAMVKKDQRYISQTLNLAKISAEIRQEIDSAETKIARQVVWDLAGFNEEQQKLLWGKIKKSPTMAELQKVAKKLQKAEEVAPKASDEAENLPDAQQVWDALQRAKKKDINNVFRFIPPKKMQKLLEEFGKE